MVKSKNPTIRLPDSAEGSPTPPCRPLLDKVRVQRNHLSVNFTSSSAVDEGQPNKDCTTAVTKVSPPCEAPTVELDPWAITELKDTSPSWSELDTKGKIKTVLWGWIGRALTLVLLLYMFICSLDLMSSSFRLLGGKALGETLNGNPVVRNPLTGLMIGVLTTVLVQSSSTSTSIIVSMVSSDALNVRQAIPMVMGANIGTSVTNTIVSMAHYGRGNEFRRAFAGATVHDMFNWLSVFVLLPIEMITGYLYALTNELVSSLRYKDMDAALNVKLLKALTEKLTKRVIQIDKKIILKLATDPSYANKDVTIIKGCKGPKTLVNVTINNITTLRNESSRVPCSGKFLFEAHGSAVGMRDEIVGLILLVVSLIMLVICLVALVKLLNSLMRGKIAGVLKKTLNADFPGKFGAYMTGYLCLVVGAVLTILVQSSSVFTSALTPLVGIGALQLERVYPLTLGANIGTTGTGLLAAMAAGAGASFANGLQIALCHLFFNVSGIILFFPIPMTRKGPINLAKMLGNTTARYRWFAFVYVVTLFFLLPAAVFGMSMIHPVVPAIVTCLVLALLITVAVVNVIQERKPELLPERFQNWMWLPEPLRSLAPYDRFLKRWCVCRCCKLTPEHAVMCGINSTQSSALSSIPGTVCTTAATTPKSQHKIFRIDDVDVKDFPNKCFVDSKDSSLAPTRSNSTILIIEEPPEMEPEQKTKL